VNRRELLGLLGAAASGAAQSPPRPDFTLHISPITVEPVPGKILRTIGYNGTAPGPLLRAPEGKTVTIEVFNDTDAPELVHWHGLHIPSAVDGAMEEGTPVIAPRKSARYRFPATPAGTRWYHTHVSAGRNLKRATYTGQYGFFYIEPKHDPGAYDREVFLSLKEWDPYLTTMGGEDSGIDVAYKYYSINGRALGHGDPIPVKQGERVMLRILNASATLHRRLAFAGHSFVVAALDGNPLATPREVPVLEMGPAERIDAVVEMNNPGVWIFGSTTDRDRQTGLGIVLEYAGQTGAPSWLAPSKEPWSYTVFSRQTEPESAAETGDEGEEIPFVFRKKFAGSRWVDNWTVNGKSFPKTDPLRVRANGRYRLIFDNQSNEDHPVHLHRHTFELTRIAGIRTSGIFKDVVVVPAMSRIEAGLVANNPGATLFHCHQQMHMDYGFMALMQYA
jgi:FtsP/CotA-like multicopper oxidase with cupredoxin domain